MKKGNTIFILTSVIFLLLNLTSKTYAIDYTISFTGTGASTTVDSVIVQNLTRNTSVKVPAGYALNIIDVTAVEQIESDYEIISIIPNPITDKSVVSFYAKQTGNTQISVAGLDGRILTGINCNLYEGKNSFEISLDKGAYILRVTGNSYSYSSMILSRSGFGNKPMLSYIGNEIKINSNAQKSKNANVISMPYITGDQLLYKGYSGNYCTIVTDKPTETKTTDFELVECKDADENYYSVVKIGTQTWMLENLKTTRYRNGDAIGTTTAEIPNDATSKYQWAYGGNEANVAKYGRLYTWYAAADSRNIVPAGWHVPTDAEWTTLETYLISNGYNYDGTTTGNKISKALAATTDWNTYTGTGTIGNDLTKNNSSGFSALPGGYRHHSGTFYGIGYNGYWWSSTRFDAWDPWYKVLGYLSAALVRSADYMYNGFSVRCIRD